jgi:hypothetical protein
MAGKDSKKAPETVTVMLSNGTRTSIGAGAPGDVIELPADEVSALLAAGYPTRVA